MSQKNIPKINVQSPLPVTGHRYGRAFRLANRRSLERARNILAATAQELKAHLPTVKNEKWIEQTNLYLEHLRYQSLDLIDALYNMGELSLEQQNAATFSVNKQIKDARTTLNATPSPLVNALHFSQNHHSIISYFASMSRRTNMVLEPERHREKEQVRTTTKQKIN